MIDMSKTIAPKSDQMNYDDFLTGTKNITITKVTTTGNINDAQPVSIYYQGDNGKPYKPCKSMRRVMVRIWGKDGLGYVGRSMTLFGDPDVIFAGKKVGGIRISHMSHMDGDIHVPLSASKTKRILYKVSSMKVDMGSLSDDDPEPYDDLYNRAEGQATEGMAAYKNFYSSLSDIDKGRLTTKGDHEKLKVLAIAIDEGTENNSG